MKDELDFYASKQFDDDDDLADKSWLNNDDDEYDEDDWEWDDDDDDWDYDDDMEVIVDSAEGFQVATTVDPEGNVIDVSVMTDEEIDQIMNGENAR